MQLLRAEWRRRFVKDLALDSRKTAILVVLTVVMCALYGRLFFMSNPDSVAASSALVAPITTVGEAGRFDDEVPVEFQPERLESVEIGSAPHDACESWVDLSTLPRTLSRDFFDADWNLFPAVPPSENGGEKLISDSATDTAEQPDGWWNLVNRVAREERERRHRKSAEVREAAASLMLQSTVVGNSPLAVINGEIVRVGDRVESFLVVGIEARRVIVRKDGITVTLPLGGPPPIAPR
jgi:hypothetical protein